MTVRGVVQSGPRRNTLIVRLQEKSKGLDGELARRATVDESNNDIVSTFDYNSGLPGGGGWSGEVLLPRSRKLVRYRLLIEGIGIDFTG